VHAQASSLHPDAERVPALLLDQPLRLAPGHRLARREDALAEVPNPLLADAARDRYLAACLQHVEHEPHVAVAPPAVRLAAGRQVVLQFTRQQRAVALELAQDVAAEAGVLLQELADPTIPGGAAGASASHHPCPHERQVLDRPDEGVPLEELPLLPQEPVQLGGVIRTEAAEKDELLRRRDGRDRVHLEEAEAPHGVKHRTGGAVEQLRANGDPSSLFWGQVFHVSPITR
jgi:hypothetical protein